MKVVIITGFTGSGKSGLAIDVAKKYNGEIVSCDSVQIYRELNIGSAKVTKKEMQGIPHHLIDILDPKEEYSVGRFIKDCDKAIKDILSRQKLPILVGGTGLYIKALLNGYDFSNAEKHEEFRAKYFDLANQFGNEYVWEKLFAINPDKANTVHPNNLKRVVRYLEVEAYGEQTNPTNSVLSAYNTLSIGIVANREYIYERINKRVDIMLEDGLQAEVQTLLNKGIDLKYNCMNTIGYREMVKHLQGDIDYVTCVNLIKQHTRNYCKRQLTFMKTIPQLKLLELGEAKQLIEEFLNDNTK